MSLGTLLTIIAIAAIILTFVTRQSSQKKLYMLNTFLQYFCGVLFVVSGFVKVVDPMGTAFKMEQYFADFETTASGSFLSFLAPLFPFLAAHSLAFSVAVILFEIILGFALIFGSKRKLTVWLFFLLVVFFTVLTGYTYLTGYVPSGTNFFEFSKWGAFKESNMRVTDCGCFGDFIKLKPFTSFMKDVFLLFPSIFFLLRWRQNHQLFTSRTRSIALLVLTVGFFAFAYRNYAMNEPIIDFRPFTPGVNIRERKQAEADADVEAGKNMTFKLTNKSSGKVVALSMDQYMKEFKNYPTEEWETEQVKGEPKIPHSKISDFAVSDLDGTDVTEMLLTAKKYLFIVISPKLKGTESMVEKTVMDTVVVRDSSAVSGDSTKIAETKQVVETKVKTSTYTWDPGFTDIWKGEIDKLSKDAFAGDSIKTLAIVAGTHDAIIDFRKQINAEYPFFVADDLLIKTIMRSNPGVVLIKDGEIIQKWHYKHLPAYSDIKSKYIKK